MQIPATQINAAGGGPTLITSTTLGAPAASIDLTSISAAYKHLWLMARLRTDSGSNDVGMRWNNDSGSNYWTINTLSASASATLFTVGYCSTSTAPADQFGTVQIWMPFYSITGGKGHNAVWTGSTVGAIFTGTGSGLWNNNTAAINRITLFTNGGSNLVAGSTVELYGFGVA